MANHLTRGKIVLVPFPFDDLSAAKLRPAVCLTEPIGANRHVIAAFITSSEIFDLLPTDIALPTNHPDFRATGLRVNSVLRLHRLITLSTKSSCANSEDFHQISNVKRLKNFRCYFL